MEDRVFDLPRYLSVLPLFSDLRRLSRGDMVFRVGEPCDAFHVTVTGPGQAVRDLAHRARRR
jgi:hypothetical protein